MISVEDREKLYAAAGHASICSYSPYSKFKVGAAVLTGAGQIYHGTNVENASYGLTICAERVAVCNAVAHGAGRILAIAVFSEPADAAPCGACRQFIAEFGLTVGVVFRKDGNIVEVPIGDLLPGAFTAEDIHS